MISTSDAAPGYQILASGTTRSSDKWCGSTFGSMPAWRKPCGMKAASWIFRRWSRSICRCLCTGDRQFGFAVRAELRQNDKLLDRRYDVFAVADNFNQVSQYGAAAPDGNPERFPASLEAYRTAGIGAIEVNFWTPCDFSDMAPSESTWISGQGLRRVRKADLQGPIEAAHRQGVRILTYGDLWACGSTGFEWARRHPDQVVWDHVYYGGEYDVDQLEAEGGRSRSGPQDRWLGRD